eukprot:57368_1
MANQVEQINHLLSSLKQLVMSMGSWSLFIFVCQWNIYATIIISINTAVTHWIANMFQLGYRYHIPIACVFLCVFICFCYYFLVQCKALVVKHHAWLLSITGTFSKRPPLDICAAVTKYKNTKCMICLQPFSEDISRIIAILSCGHCYHRLCLSSWELIGKHPFKCVMCNAVYNNSSKWNYKYTKETVSKGHLDMDT